MVNELISVIVPVYNTRDYLPKCIDSIVEQTYKSLEILLIDDGSTDGSEIIVDEYARKDERIKAIHQINHGESYTRNVGIKQATGEYIAFVDCDDWLEKDAYETLLQSMINSGTDLSCAGWYKDEEIIKNKNKVVTDVFDQKQLLRYLYQRDDYRAFAYMWNKLYKRELVQGGFPEQLKLGGDVVFLAEVALKTNRAVYIDKPVYHYRQRINSGCHDVDLTKKAQWIEAYEIIISEFEKASVEKETIAYAKRFMAYHASNFLELSIKQKEEEFVRYFQKVMKEQEKIYIELNKNYPDRIERYKKLLET